MNRAYIFPHSEIFRLFRDFVRDRSNTKKLEDLDATCETFRNSLYELIGGE